MLNRKPLGICPKCGETVKEGQDAVWTSRCNLNHNNPFYEPCGYEQAGARGDDEYDHMDCIDLPGMGMPLHGKCYAKGNY